MILGLYIRKKTINEMKSADFYSVQLEGNLALLEKEITSHPETIFKISIPPYSMLWWDNIYRYGDTESYLYNLETAMERLLSFENVELYFFLNDRKVVTNLENYMDLLHFSPEINEYICNAMAQGSHKVTWENYGQIMADLRGFAYEVTEELVKPYEERIKVDIYD